MMNKSHQIASQIAAEVVDARTARELHKDGADALWVRRLVEEGARRALNLTLDPEPWVRTYDGLNPKRLPNSPIPYGDYFNGYGQSVVTNFRPRPEYSQNREDYR
jgi:hypothetical protein